MKMNLPNKLTIFRMILVIFMAAVPVVDYFMGGIPGSVCGVATAFIIIHFRFFLFISYSLQIVSHEAITMHIASQI